MARRPALAVAAGLALLLVLWGLVGVGALRGLDGPVHAWTLRHRPPGSGTLIKWLLAGEMLVLAGMLGWLLRGHLGLLARLGALVVGAEGVVWALKHAGRGWDMPWYANNFPSGHTTVGALLCLLLARVLTALPGPDAGVAGMLRGVCFALAGLFGALAVFPMAHVPSEMVGGFVLAGTVAQIGAGWIAAALPPRAPGARQGWASGRAGQPLPHPLPAAGMGVSVPPFPPREGGQGVRLLPHLAAAYRVQKRDAHP